MRVIFGLSTILHLVQGGDDVGLVQTSDVVNQARVHAELDANGEVHMHSQLKLDGDSAEAVLAEEQAADHKVVQPD